MKLDMCAFEEQFVDHLAAVWHRLPDEARGDFIVPSRLKMRAAARGILGSPEINEPRRPILVSSYGDLKKARQLGRTRIAFIEHGAGQSYWGDPRSAGAASYSGGRDRDDISLFLVPNDDAASRWRATYPRARVAVVGSPKAEQLPARDAFGIRPTGRAVVPLPVRRRARGRHRLAGVPREAHARHRPVQRHRPRPSAGVRHARPAPALRAGEHPADRGLRGGLPAGRRVRRRQQLSAIFEFASTGRPVVVLNAKTYRLGVRHGLRFDPSDGCEITSRPALLRRGPRRHPGRRSRPAAGCHRRGPRGRGATACGARGRARARVPAPGGRGRGDRRAGSTRWRRWRPDARRTDARSVRRLPRRGEGRRRRHRPG